MPFEVIRNDITKVHADAIVNTANPLPVFAPGTDKAIYLAAGKDQLLEERRKIGMIPRGQAAITSAFALPARYIIHTVGPEWIDGHHQEEKLLTSCLKESLKLAVQHECGSIAFPLISTGVYGFPKEKALKIFTSVIYDFLMDNDMLVYLVIYDKESLDISSRLFQNIPDYIDDSTKITDLKEQLQQVDESFHECLIRLLIDCGMKNSEVYHRANITKQHFSKIISNPDYHPGKNTICALAIGMKLDLETAESLLEKAGYVLSHSSKFDMAVEFFIRNGMYNIVDDNIILFDSGLELLGTGQ